MMGNLTIPEQPSEQRQGVLRDRGVDETFLSLQRLNRTAAWLVVIIEGVIIEGRINDFRVEFTQLFSSASAIACSSRSAAHPERIVHSKRYCRHRASTPRRFGRQCSWR